MPEQQDSSNLLDELENIQTNQAVDETPEQETETAMTNPTKPKEPDVYDHLETIGITKAQVDAWKQTYGAAYVFAPSDSDIYLWRPLFKKEWDILQQKMNAIKSEDDEQAQAKAAQLEATVIEHCVLHPRLNKESLKNSRAGLQSTLFELIMAGSYFISARDALSLVIEL